MIPEPVPQQNSDEESSLHIRDLFLIFLRRRRLFLYLALPVFLGIIVYRISRPYNPLYLATFDIGVSNERPVEGFFSQYTETPATQIGAVTQRVITNLLSVNFTSKVVDSLSLYVHVKNANSDLKIETRLTSDFGTSLGPYIMHIRDNTVVLLTRNGETVVEGSTGQDLDLGSLTFRITPLKKIREKTYHLVFFARDRVALALRNSLSINVLEADRIEKSTGSSGFPGSGEGASKKLVTAKTIFPGMNLVGILRINLYWGNPGDALKIAQVLADRIIREDIGEKSLQFIQSRTFIESQLTLYQDKLNLLEDDIQQFKETKKIADLKASTQALISQISTLESRKNQIQIEQQIVTNLSNYLQKEQDRTDSMPNFAATLLSSSALQGLYAQLLQAEAEYKTKLKEYAGGHPKVLAILARIDGLKSQLKEEIAKRLATIKTEIASVQNQIGFLQVKLESVPSDEISLARLERDRETAEKLYTFFAEKLEETRVQEAGVTSDLKIVNPPVVISRPVNSRGLLVGLVLAFVIGSLVGGAGIFIAEYFDNTVKDLEMVKTKLGLPVFAAIPDVEEDRGNNQHHQHGKRGFLRSVQAALLPDFIVKSKNSHKKIKMVVGDTSSAEFEAFRKLAIHLDFAHPEKKFRVIYITSPGPEEGKTFVAVNLSTVLAMVGKNVIIVDSDFRKKKGHLTDIARYKKQCGLFDILKGEVKLQEAVVPWVIGDEETEHSKQEDRRHLIPASVRFLPVGSVPPNPFVFLESQKMKEVLEELGRTYDYVIIDGLPSLLFADAAYLARYSDGVFLMCRFGHTLFRELEHAREMLAEGGTNIIGVIMNSVPRSSSGYYYHYHYYYKYYPRYYRQKE